MKEEYLNHNFYAGADYGLDPKFSDEYSLNFGADYRPAAGAFGFTTDPRTTNQLNAVSQKLNTGAKSVEVQGVQAAELEAIPKQHFKEMHRLSKLSGVDLTFHGPLVEASGIKQEGWTEGQRLQAERQMLNAINRAHDLKPDGNIVVTFHTTSGLPEMIEREMTEKCEKATEMYVFDERI
jgi:hypothetical protein